MTTRHTTSVPPFAEVSMPAQNLRRYTRERRLAWPAFRTVLLFQRLGASVYADEACFTELGPDRDKSPAGFETVLTAPEHAALCAVPSVP